VNSNLKVYFISGLAADRTVFRHIQLPSHCEPVYLDWIPPQKNESLATYALRMAEKINPDEKFSLIGLSMGGMITVEICRHFNPVHTILISSISSSAHLPKYYRYLGALQLHRSIPISLFQKGAVIRRMFTSETVEDKRMLRAMINRSDADFIRWAFDAILNWRSAELSSNIVHIHGSNDKILPRRLTKPTHIIPRAGHLMILNRAGEINGILAEIFGSEW